MTPNFALTLSFDGITLLRRVPGGWAQIGDVALDADDLRAALADLRLEAETFADDGGQVKLVIPNEQIKYLSAPDPELEGDALEAEIKARLDGATPYAVSDLTFDWTRRDGTLHIAAVANETLDEAEAFAKSHHFEPVCFAASAPPETFETEVYFGPAASWTGSAPVKDTAPLKIVPAPIEPPVPAAPPTPKLPVAEIVEKKQVAASGGEAEAPTASGKASEDKIAEPTTSGESPADEAAALAPGAADDRPATEQPAPTPPPTLRAETAEPTAPSFASIRASRTAPASKASPPAPRVAPPSRADGARTSGRDGDIIAPGLQVAPTEDHGQSAQDRKGLGFFSRRKEDAPKSDVKTPTAPAPAKTNVPSDPKLGAPRPDPTPAREAVARIAAMRAGRGDAAAPVQDTAEPDERQRMTIFGARTEPQIGGKPRYLGLMLTSALLIFLLAVAAWASVFLDDGLSRLFDRDSDTPSIARMPDVELLPLDGSVTAPPPEDEEADVELAALDTGDASAQDGGLSDPLPPPAALTPDEAAARYAASGIWQRSPSAPEPPTMTTLEDLYVASIDGAIQQFDAVALPSAEALRNDQAYLSLPNPALPGTRFTLDERGLVIATVEGTINPDGVRIFAGLPPVVPPARPDAPEPAPLASDGDAAAPQEARLQGFRPKTRPEGLVEGAERAQLAGRTFAELEALRPTARPETLKAAEEEAQPDATQFAVAQSVAPVNRPRDFARVVTQARQTPQPQAQSEVTQVASVAPRAVQPRIPSAANVAQQATMRNAINLRRINLIGVYGKPSSRRALIRLSNGRYQKVQVGDRLDGGRVAAIDNDRLLYVKNGRNVVLDMPDG